MGELAITPEPYIKSHTGQFEIKQIQRRYEYRTSQVFKWSKVVQ